MNIDTWRAIIPILLYLLSFNTAQASNVLVVDTGIASDCADYSIETRACEDGSATAYPTPKDALEHALPGDTVWLRGGRYGPIDVAVSGRIGQPIEILAFAGEEAVITAPDGIAIRVVGQHDIIIRDLFVSDAEGFGRFEDAQRIWIDRVGFRNAWSSGTTGALKFVRSDENRVSNSSFDRGSDLLIFQDASDRNLVTGNTFGFAKHSLISIRCSGKNIIRDNEFANPRQKAMEIYDCEGISDAPFRLDSTVRNIVERNWFRLTAPSGRNHNYNAIQHGGQQTIVRQNVFSGNQGGGVNYQSYPDESLFVHGNRMYNNTFLNNRCGAIIGQRGARGQMYDNVVVNNLLFGNVDCGGAPRQVAIEFRRTVMMRDNLVTTQDPRLLGDQRHQCPADDSPVIDSGSFVAVTTMSGSGTRIPVDDTYWFSDGYGVVNGDSIQLRGDQRRVSVIGVDDGSRTVEVSEAISWEKNQGIHLAYVGAAPDQGAFEFGSPQCDGSHSADNPN